MQRKARKRAVIALTPGQHIRKDKHKPGGRRRYPFGYNYVDSYVGRRGKNKPRCLAKGCQRTLRVHQPAVCSETCANSVINDALLRLKLCQVTKDQLLALYE